MTTKETPASSNDDETTQAQTTTEALEWHAPVLVRIDEHTTIPHLLKERVQRSATRPLILRKIGIGDTWRSITAREFYDEVHALAAGLIARGLQPGDRVAIMSRTRYEWTLLDFACWAAGLVPVPIYETSSIDQVAHVLVDADVHLIITETVSMAEIVRAAAERENRDNTHVLSLDSEASTMSRTARTCSTVNCPGALPSHPGRVAKVAADPRADPTRRVGAPCSPMEMPMTGRS